MGNEARLQAAVEEILLGNGIEFQREFRLSSRDRIDFLAGAIGIECKVDGSPALVLPQLLRYAEHESISGIVLVTTRNTHRFSATELLGKPLSVVFAGAVL